MQGPNQSRTGGIVRVNGIAVLVAIVLVGLLTGAGFYRYQRGRMDLRVAGEVAAAPSDPAERVALWLRLIGPQIHHRLAVVGRFTPDLPWLVTHAVAVEDGGPPQVFGIDCGSLAKDLAHAEGLNVVVELPAPRLLGRVDLEGERATKVPIYASEVRPDPSERLSGLALYLLESIPSALGRDIPGAKLVIRVADERAERTE